MDNKTLSETDMINGLFDALTSGDASKVNQLMESELNQQVEPETDPAIEPDNLSSSGVDTEVTDETKPADQPDGEVTKEDTTPGEDDWRSKLPEEIKDKVLQDFSALESEYRRLNQYRNSNEGRVSGLQKKINELTNTLEKLTAKPADPAQTTQVSEEENPVLAELKDSDPGLYKALNVILEQKEKTYKSELSKLQAEIDNKLTQSIAPIQQERQQEFVRREAERVKQVVPEVEQIVRSPEWATFLNNTSDYVRGLAESASADDFLAALDIFTMNLYRQEQAQVSQKPAPTQAQPSARADKVVASRTQRISSSTPVTRAPASAPTMEVNEAALLEQMFQDIRKKEGYK